MTKNKNQNLLSLVLILLCSFVFSQNDSVRLKEIVITSYLENRPVLRLPASAAVIDSSQIQKQSGQSFVPVLNTVPGVRMEERSPGSYRLSIRGSLIRSPFGIRNTKIYLDEFPLTNAGGDAYLNLIDLNAISNIEIMKGPDGSLFGANSGGVVKIAPTNLSSTNSRINIGVGVGSYGLFQQNIGIVQQIGKNNFSIQEGWQRADGYRKNTAMDRKYFQLANRFNYSSKGQLRFLVFYSDLNYQTPGGLTLAQYQQDPQMARPATKFVPGPVEQKAAVRNRTLYGGVVNEYKITDRIRHVIAVFGSQTLFENPFITNYEVRNESNGGARTWFEFKNRNTSGIQLTFNVGAEAQAQQSNIGNYGNNKGVKDTVQAIDHVTVSQGFAFARFVADFYNKWLVETSLSYNYNQFVFARQLPVATGINKKIFDPQFMPRIAASYLVTNYFSLRAIISRGYSPPTLSEIRPSDNNINTTLQAESGWNYETGFRLRIKDGLLWWDASVFYYKLSDAIVKQTNAVGQDYFINAGGTYQPGAESQLTLQLIKLRKQNFIRGLTLTNAYTYQAYTFYNYKNEAQDFSGKNVTGVPQHVSVTGLTVNFPYNFYMFTQYNYTARIPLNDANSDYAKEYHLVQFKAGWKFFNSKRFTLDICAGIDNLLDQKYSLGNDLNAIGNRYYNAALGRNYFSRLNIWF